MSKGAKTTGSERAAMLAWAARIGAVTAEALAHRDRVAIASARARLALAAGDRLLASQRILVGQPTLYTVTRAGLRAAGLAGIDPSRLSAASARHMILCARAAAALERGYPDHLVVGERELRSEELKRGCPPASALLGRAGDGRPLLHRPDLLLRPRGGTQERPIAVEIELTSKAPRRLADICLAWARCRSVGGVLYIAAPEAERALERAVEAARAAQRIVIAPLDSIALDEHETGDPPIARTVAGGT